ncbi:MAG: hypothetical protein MJE68_04990 [Proteobacteria bacterium]|nr:hypothetical protein [Pseudomonadota bacterium]
MSWQGPKPATWQGNLGVSRRQDIHLTGCTADTTLIQPDGPQATGGRAS